MAKVLLIEDDPTLVDMYKLKFTEQKFELVVTEKGGEGLELAKKEKFDIILLDIMLPEIDGFSILKELKASPDTKDIPVILLTNLAQETDKEKGIKMGAVDYLVKANHTPTQVVDKVRKILHT
ncbi:response regulator [Patescibacteria group bacterium]|nr:response regulator [Patescibacteria group bacterium]